MTFRNIGIINIFILFVIAVLGVHPWHFLLLTVAQLVYVPLILNLVMKNDDGKYARYLPYLGIPAFLTVILLQVTSETSWDPFLAIIYFLFTLLIAGYGLMRFFNRGFAHLEEFLIDMGLIYIAVGGAWFFAYEAGIDTGFSAIMTWLTGIHFHYAAFLLPVFVGFLGRIYKSTFYNWIAAAVLVSPMIVALGITFSTLLELVSVLVYIFGIYGLINLSFKSPVNWLVRLSFSALGVAILFSLLYAFGNLTGLYTITIDFMLIFHGTINAVFYALAGIIGWSIQYPPSKHEYFKFPVSRIRGKGKVGETILTGKLDTATCNGLVDNMNIYDIDAETLSSSIIDFYENTNQYRLFSEVKWHTWFKPFAAVYRLISRYVEQINLPFSSKQVEMTGNIYSIKDDVDGRNDVRAWVRKVKKETTFVALYSSHENKGQTYMNIALPLPGSVMVGVLDLTPHGKDLRLSSKKQSLDADSGIYLAAGKFFFMLPIEEQFDVWEVEEGVLKARHNMWIFSIPFLTIEYDIFNKLQS
ncbi:YndJ family protein [Virgibacillus doumboii]|uniref:YndJ family protein n=1 Tax=Virgibacillus doumboii TaxID=2697503 RepID=UPI0013DF8CC1|nr:YndJ family protein [Virgibacillus doumboii]